MSAFAYVFTSQILSGDFIFAMPIDDTNFAVPTGAGGLYSFGVSPAYPVLTAGSGVSGQVQTQYPGRPYFGTGGVGFRANGIASAETTYANGDILNAMRSPSPYESSSKYSAPDPFP